MQSTYTQHEINRMAYNASIAAAFGYYSNEFTNPAFLREAFAFCNHTCSVIAWLDFQGTQAVSEYYYTVSYGSCANSIVTPHW